MDDSGVVLQWRKSSDSGTGDCVEVAVDDQQVYVRDSKNPQGGHLSFTYAEWIAFLNGIDKGEFTLSSMLQK
jgi:hypothetical protein